MRLSKTTLAGLRPRDDGKPHFEWDDDLQGFGVKVHGSGLSAVVQYRTRGRSVRLTIGRLSEALTISQARARAQDLLAQARLGQDPAAERRAARASLTVEQLVGEYLRSPAFEAKADKTRAVDSGRIRNYIVPKLGRKIAADITPDDVRALHDAIADGRLARIEKGDRPRGRRVVKGGPGTAAQVVVLLGAVWAWALVHCKGAVAENPTQGVQRAQPGRREIAAAPGDFGRILAAIDGLQEEHRLPQAAANALRLIVGTGLRAGEAAGLRWRQVDLAQGTLRFEPREHKGGKRSGRARTVYLTPGALAAIEAQPKGEPESLVFPPASGAAIRLSRPWQLVRERAGLPVSFVLHGTRHAVGSALAQAGLSAQQIAAQLGHASARTAERYVTFEADTRRRIAGVLAERIAGETAATEGER